MPATADERAAAQVTRSTPRPTSPATAARSARRTPPTGRPPRSETAAEVGPLTDQQQHGGDGDADPVRGRDRRALPDVQQQHGHHDGRGEPGRHREAGYQVGRSPEKNGRLSRRRRPARAQAEGVDPHDRRGGGGVGGGERAVLEQHADDGSGEHDQVRGGGEDERGDRAQVRLDPALPGLCVTRPTLRASSGNVTVQTSSATSIGS